MKVIVKGWGEMELVRLQKVKVFNDQKGQWMALVVKPGWPKPMVVMTQVKNIKKA